jgi:acetate kinase
MGTRCGALDPGVILYLEQERGMTANRVEDLLYCRSGLLSSILSGNPSEARRRAADFHRHGPNSSRGGTHHEVIGLEASDRAKEPPDAL